MSHLFPYLVYSGNCKEAMEFYAECLDGEIKFMQTFGESPIDVPEEAKNTIFNSELIAQGIRIKASDDLPGYEVKKGTNISLYISFPDEASKQTAFSRLAEGGKILFPIEDNFGMLTDKFGVQWMVVHGED